MLSKPFRILFAKQMYEYKEAVIKSFMPAWRRAEPNAATASQLFQSWLTKHSVTVEERLDPDDYDNGHEVLIIDGEEVGCFYCVPQHDKNNQLIRFTFSFDKNENAQDTYERP